MCQLSPGWNFDCVTVQFLHGQTPRFTKELDLCLCNIVESHCKIPVVMLSCHRKTEAQLPIFCNKTEARAMNGVERGESFMLPSTRETML